MQAVVHFFFRIQVSPKDACNMATTLRPPARPNAHTRLGDLETARSRAKTSQPTSFQLKS